MYVSGGLCIQLTRQINFLSWLWGCLRVRLSLVYVTALWLRQWDTNLVFELILSWFCYLIFRWIDVLEILLTVLYSSRSVECVWWMLRSWIILWECEWSERMFNSKLLSFLESTQGYNIFTTNCKLLLAYVVSWKIWYNDLLAYINELTSDKYRLWSSIA